MERTSAYLCSILWLHVIDWSGLAAGVDGTELAASRASVTHQHHSGCGCLSAPALTYVRTLRLFTYRGKVQTGELSLDALSPLIWSFLPKPTGFFVLLQVLLGKLRKRRVCLNT